MLPLFQSFMPTVTKWIATAWRQEYKVLTDNATGAPIGIVSPNANGPQGIWAPTPLSAAQIETPAAEMVADLNATYQLNEPPYTRYRSNGTELVVAGSDVTEEELQEAVAAAEAAAADSEAAAAASIAAAIDSADARDASIVNAQTYVNIAAGMAATTIGDTFDVQGTGDVAVIRYRKTGAGANDYEYLFSMPSAAAVKTVPTGLVNLVDPATFTDGQSITSSGVPFSNASFTLSPLYYVDPSSLYSRAAGGGMTAYFDVNLDPIASAGTADRVFITNAAARWARTSFPITSKSTSRVVRGNVTPLYSQLVPRTQTKDDVLLKSTVEDAIFSAKQLLPDLKIGLVNANTLRRSSINLFNEEEVQAGYYIAFNTINVSGTTSQTGIIPCTPNTVYTCNQAGYRTEYGATGLVVASVASGGPQVFTTGPDTYGFSTSVQNSFIPQYMIALGDVDLSVLVELPALKVPYHIYSPVLQINTGRLLDPYGNNLTVGVFGDSQVEGFPGYRYPAYIQQQHGGRVANLGIGGTRMAIHNLPGYADVSFFKLMENVASGNFDSAMAAVIYIYEHYPPDYNIPAVERMISVNWASAVALLADYGTNDYGGSVPLGTIGAGPLSDGSTFIGAMMYGIETALNARQQLLMQFKTPAHRATDTANGAGLYLGDYADAMLQVCERYSLPCLDFYHSSGINTITAPTMLLPDGLHYTEQAMRRCAQQQGDLLTSRIGFNMPMPPETTIYTSPLVITADNPLIVRGIVEVVP